MNEVMQTPTSYSVLNLSLEDAILLDEWAEDADNPRKYRTIYNGLDDEQKIELANQMGEWMYDGDLWEEGLRQYLLELSRRETTNPASAKAAA